MGILCDSMLNQIFLHFLRYKQQIVSMRIFFIFLFTSISSVAQIGMGQWRQHVPANRALDVVALTDRVFTAFENGVSEYEFASGELSTWNAVNALSDISLTCLGHSTAQNAVFIGYENGNIDKIKNNQVTNIPAIKLANVQGSKRINNIVEYKGYMYFATGFSIVKIDPNKNEVRETYYPTNGNKEIIDIAFRSDSIYALTGEEMYVGYVNNIALADPTQWTLDPRFPVLSSTSTFNDLEVINDSLFALKIDGSWGKDTVFVVRENSYEPILFPSWDPEMRSMSAINGDLVLNIYGAIAFYETNTYSQVKVINNDYSGPSVYSYNNGIAYGNGSYWIADNFIGLSRYTNENNYETINFVGPPKGDFYALDWDDGVLAVAGGGLTGVGATFNASGIYLFEDEKWSLKDRYNSPEWDGLNIWDHLTVSVNKVDKNIIATGTYSNVPLSIINGDNITVYTPENSIIEETSLGNGWTLVSEVEYDDEGNLWILNGYASKPLKVLTKDGNWYEFDTGLAPKNKFTIDLKIDFNGNKWFSVVNQGLFGYNDNGTISNTSDDKYVYLNSGELSGALPSNLVNAIAVDFDNEIWIATDNGFAVLYNSEGAFDAGPGEYNAQRIKVEFEGNVEYVLGSTYISDIVVDGANRKWFGTQNAGIILLSQDGSEIIEHHTAENSPLISNNILDLEMDQNTGELYIITDKGLVSYRTDASYEDPEYENVVVFPNPARPDFEGPITIQGIRYNSDVKITDVAGNLVYKTTSNGGTATWNKRTLTGEKVATGVYLIWTAANEGKGRKVGKVLVVN